MALMDSSVSMNIDDNIKSAEKNTNTYSALSKAVNFNGVIIQDPQTIFHKYRELFEANLVEIELDRKYHHKPELIARQYYGTTDLWWMVLWVNNMVHHYEFDLPKVKIVDLGLSKQIGQIINANVKILKKNKAEVETISDLTIYPVIV